MMRRLRDLLARLRREAERLQQAQREAYLQGAGDIFELERRMRDLERADVSSVYR